MPFRYRSLTANCGNDTIGQEASKQIADRLHQDQADFYVINCQEVNFAKTLKQLQKAVGDDYIVTLTHKMPTHTKFSTQFHDNTGLTNFIIHKKDLTLSINTTQEVRRSTSQLKGSDFNKGGLIVDLVISGPTGPTSNESLKLQTISGHLESNNFVKRSHDWHQLNQALAKNISNWSELVDAFPQIRLSGYDANTRNRLQDGESVNLWLKSPNTAELQALNQATLAGQHYSKPSTYKTDSENIDKTADKKRQGYTKGGMLDFVGIADGRPSKFTIDQQETVQIGMERGTERDHDIIISPLQQSVHLSTFDLIKKQMATSLSRLAPNLAEELVDLTDEEENREKLVKIYQLLLSPEGLLNQYLTQHTQKLDNFYNHFNFSFSSSSSLKDKVAVALFPENAWFNSLRLQNIEASSQQLEQKLHLTNLLMFSLGECQCESSVNNRLQWYQQLETKIKDGSYSKETAIQQFSDLRIKEFRDNYRQFVNSLKKYTPQNENEQNLFQMGKLIVHEMHSMVPDKAQIKTMPTKDLALLNAVLEQCNNTMRILNEGGDITPVCQRLGQLSQEVSGHASSAWKKLGAGLLMFAGLALVVAGVLTAVPSGGASILLAVMGAGLALAGSALMENTGERGLANAVSMFKSSLKDITDDNASTELTPLKPGN